MQLTDLDPRHVVMLHLLHLLLNLSVQLRIIINGSYYNNSNNNNNNNNNNNDDNNINNNNNNNNNKNNNNKNNNNKKLYDLTRVARDRPGLNIVLLPC